MSHRVMSLLDLPPELFGQIMHTFVEDAPLPAIFNSREVCRTFLRHIDYELMGVLTPKSLAVKFANCRKETGRTHIWFPRKDIETYLHHQLRARRRNGKEDSSIFFSFLHAIADRLQLDVVRSSDVDDMKAHYVNEIASAVARTTPMLAFRLLFEPNLPRIEGMMRYLKAQKPHVWDELSASAAVGNLDAVKRLVQYPSDNPNQDFVQRPQSLLRHPIEAAAVNGQLEVLQYLLELLKDLCKGSMRGTILAERYPACYCFDLPNFAHAAINARQCESIKCLVEVMSDLYPKQARSSECRGPWLQAAIEAGCVRTLEVILATEPVHKLADSQMVLCASYGYDYACRNGYADMVLYLIRENYIKQLLLKRGDTHSSDGICIAIRNAIRNGDRSLVRILLANGHNICSAEMFQAAWSARFGSKLTMINFLLEHGFMVDIDTLEVATHHYYCDKMIKKVRVWKRGCPTADEVKAVIRLGEEAKNNLPRVQIPEEFRQLLETICGKLKTERLPEALDEDYYEVAADLYSWIAKEDKEEELAQDLERLELVKGGDQRALH